MKQSEVTPAFLTDRLGFLGLLTGFACVLVLLVSAPLWFAAAQSVYAMVTAPAQRPSWLSPAEIDIRRSAAAHAGAPTARIVAAPADWPAPLLKAVEEKRVQPVALEIRNAGRDVAEFVIWSGGLSADVVIPAGNTERMTLPLDGRSTVISPTRLGDPIVLDINSTPLPPIANRREAIVIKGVTQ